MKALSMYPQFRAMILVVLPRILQGGIAAFGDYYTWKLAENIYGQGSKTAWTAVRALSPNLL
jgi:phosphatidylinositol glycan class B